MLTSFFSKSKPINFIAVILFMAVFFIIANFQELFSSFSLLLFAEKIGVFLAFFLSVVVLDFIAKKNDLTPVSYTHLRAHETKANLVCRLLLEKKKKKKKKKKT